MSTVENNAAPNNNDNMLTNILSTAIQIPGFKVDRANFLKNQFRNSSIDLQESIIKDGPVEAGFSKSDLRKKAEGIVNNRTLLSTGASFIAGLPGGLAMAATVPADVLQFYANALGMAQEIAYLYGEEDLWSGNLPDNQMVTNQLILYCGVMLGSSGAAQATRIMTSALTKQALTKIPQKALTKTFYYPVVKSVAKFFGAKMTKDVFAKGISKAVPLIGGIVSGGITLATLRPMGLRLIDVLEEAHFSYTEEELQQDLRDVIIINEKDEEKEENNKGEIQNNESIPVETSLADATIMPFASAIPVASASTTNPQTVMEKILQAKQLLDAGAINEEEFGKIKASIMAQM